MTNLGYPLKLKKLENLNNLFKKEVKMAKENFYKKNIADLKLGQADLVSAEQVDEMVAYYLW